MKQRIVAFLLCALMLVPMLLVACNDGSTSTDSKGTSLDVGGTGDSLDTAERLEVPEGIEFDGENFYVLSAGNVAYNDFGYKEDTTENVVIQAQQKRAAFVETLYDIVIEEEIVVDKNSKGGGPGYTKIAESVLSNTVVYHLGIIGGYDVASLARSNLLYDLNSVPYVDTTKSWWDQNANEDLTIKGLLLFTNGSLSAAYSESTFAMFFNKELAAQHLTDDQNPYDLVKEHKWTIDKFSELAKGVSVDLNGNGETDYDDRFGFYVWDDSVIGMIEAAGSKICTVDESGKINLTLYNENTLNMFNSYTEIAFDNANSLTYQRYSGKINTLGNWESGHTLFWANSTGIIPTIRTMETDFGILPYPMLSEEQDRYYSTIAPYNSQFICIPLVQEDIEFVGAITEALAYYGKEYVTPAVFEQALKGLYSRDEESYDMLDIIFSSYGYDLGLYYQIGTYPTRLLNLVRNKSTAFNSMYEGYEIPAKSEIEALNASFDLVVESWKD